MSAPKYRPYGKIRERFSKALEELALREPWWKDVRTLADLIRATRHEEAEARKTAIWLLGQLKYNRADRALIWVLGNDPDIDNRGSAADWLGHLSTERAVTALLDALQNAPHLEVRERAASGLRSTPPDARITDALIAVMANKEEDPFVREMVAEALYGHDPAKAAPVLVESLRDESVNVRYWSAASLTEMKCAKALPELARLASTDTAICYDPDGTSWVYGSVSGAAAKALIQIKNDLGLALTEDELEYSRLLSERSQLVNRYDSETVPGERISFSLGTRIIQNRTDAEAPPGEV